MNFSAQLSWKFGSPPSEHFFPIPGLTWLSVSSIIEFFWVLSYYKYVSKCKNHILYLLSAWVPGRLGEETEEGLKQAKPLLCSKWAIAAPPQSGGKYKAGFVRKRLCLGSSPMLDRVRVQHEGKINPAHIASRKAFDFIQRDIFINKWLPNSECLLYIAFAVAKATPDRLYLRWELGVLHVDSVPSCELEVPLKERCTRHTFESEAACQRRVRSKVTCLSRW